MRLPLLFNQFILLVGICVAFVPPPTTTTTFRHLNRIACRFLSSTTTTSTAARTTGDALEPKDLVKIFGRLAEKYIMLDDTGGMCCYSACSDCEFRLPGGGYRMADQSASRPKWIPVYQQRTFQALDKRHITKWSTELFSDGIPAVDQQTFTARLVELEFATPLGGPFVSKSAGSLDTTHTTTLDAIHTLWGLLAGDKEKLTKHRMSTRLSELAGGEQGLTWTMFEKAMLQL